MPTSPYRYRGENGDYFFRAVGHPHFDRSAGTHATSVLIFTSKKSAYTLATADGVMGAKMWDALRSAGKVETEREFRARKEAHALHAYLGHKGYRDHRAFARDVLGEDVPHFRTLSPDKMDRLRAAA